MKTTMNIFYGAVICALGISLTAVVPASAEISNFSAKKNTTEDVKAAENSAPVISADKPAEAVLSVDEPVAAAVSVLSDATVAAPALELVPAEPAVIMPVDVPAAASAEVTEVPKVMPKQTPKEMPKEMPAAKKPAVKTGFAQGEARIFSTDPKVELKGYVHFTETKDGLKVEAEVFNVPGPGEHGFHIHELGSCEDKGNTAGGHYNPMSAQHGFLPKDGVGHAHAGDMGSIKIDETGHGTLTVVLPGVSLSAGPANVDGRAVILHEKADDFSQPTGNAGGRIGCGLIAVTSES